MSQLAYNEDSESNKRARFNDRDDNKTTKHIPIVHGQLQCQLLQYSFLVQSVVQHLTDRNVLTRLLLTCRLIKSIIIHYPLKQPVAPSRASTLSHATRYLPVAIIHMKDVTSEDLSQYPRLRSVKYDQLYDGQIRVPDTVTAMFINFLLNQPWQRDMFPPQLKRLALGNSFNQAILPGVLPHSLTYLSLGDSFEQLLPGALPPFLVELHVKHATRPIQPGTPPSTLKHLSNGHFDRAPIPVGSLPNGLVHLSAEDAEIVEDALPDSLTHLCTRRTHSGGVVLPPFLTHFNAGCPDTLSDVETFPPTLTHLVIDVYADPPLEPIGSEEGLIPSTVTFLAMCHRALPGAIPNSVTHLEILRPHQSIFDVGTIPNSVTTLVFGPAFKGQLLPPGVIPSSVTSLDLGNYDQRLGFGVIPNSVKTLTFGELFEGTLNPCAIPQSVTKLTFHGTFKQPLMSLDFITNLSNTNECPNHVTIRSVPDSVVELQCSWPAGAAIPVGDIPSSVRKLSLGPPSDSVSPSKALKPGFHVLLPGSIPSSVTDLDMGYYYNSPIYQSVSPASVQYMCLGPHFQQDLLPEWSGSPNLYRSDADLCERSKYTRPRYLVACVRSDYNYTTAYTDQ